ncbi:hypothetical protein Ddye_007905 [Dipteronia dyeriana]|uniref:Omega-hydroxypalmitate O-feruloyl transferase n=1 Tax=Dipteronia dyeriana TaxID=168575 RepID=A0AAD9XL41_9ROSI|nr:hypothetical protein Ddye_007905 [Dipteronia dyeriana]
MGSLSQELPPLQAKDLKIKIHDSRMVLPAQKTERRSMFLSNIDQVLNFSVETVHFFPLNKDFPPHAVAEKLRSALANILVTYDFMAGRLTANPNTDRLEIDCNGAGAVFVVASSECPLDEIGDLVYPNPAFKDLIVKSLDSLPLEKEDYRGQPLCIVQVTSFKCGGFAMGLSTNHTTLDGLSFKIFLDNLAALASDKPLVVIPCNDRHLLAARCPPRVTFDHPEMIKLNIPLEQDSNSNASIFDDTQEDLDFKIFRLTSDIIAHLKEKAKKAIGRTQNLRYITGFNVVTAHVWRCKALSLGDDPERESRLLYAVDIRPRLNPPLPASYLGNAVLSAYTTAKCKELEEGPFSKLVEMVSEGAKRITDEYARSAIDWGEVYKGFPHGEFLISSWWKLGFANVEYPWGRPRYSCPVVYHRKDIILLFPDIDNDNGVNVLVSLPSKDMDKFHSLFHKLLDLKD